MDTREKIIEFIKQNGPVLPVQVSKAIGSNILMASAHLAELSSSQRIKISSLKVGGSPLYYLSGQEESLLKFKDNLNEKEIRTVNLLEDKKILRDSEQTPLVRVTLREVKDFAFPFNVNFNEIKDIFWKWFLISDDAAKELIKSQLGIKDKPIDKIIKKQVEIGTEDDKKYLKTDKKEPDEHPTEKIKEQTEGMLKQEPRKTTRKNRAANKEDLFLKEITDFFKINKINVVSVEIIKKNSEFDFIVEIPSVVGNLKHYCKARNKKRISDTDLSQAFVKGQFKNLPVVFLSSGELNNKAKEMMEKELKNITFKKV